MSGKPFKKQNCPPLSQSKNNKSIFFAFLYVFISSGLFQTKDILSTEVFRRFWVEITEDHIGLRIEVGRDEESTAFMSRTWMVGLEPIPWSDIRYVGFTSYRGSGDKSMTEMKFLTPSNILTRLHYSRCMTFNMLRSPGQAGQIQSSAIFLHQDSHWRISD